MQRTTRTTGSQPSRSTPAQANRAVNGQVRSASPQVSRTPITQAGGVGSPTNGTVNSNPVICKKCKSQQIVANKRGYSFANMFKTLGWMALLPLVLVLIGSVGTYYFLMNTVSGSGMGIIETLMVSVGIVCWISISLSLPVSILVGFVGRSEIVNGCMNCGFKWAPAKRK